MRKIRSSNANNNVPTSKVFDINLLENRPFELSRLEGFVDGHDDIFDVLSQKQPKEQNSHSF
ncbi:MAG: hypothetical protein AB8B83_04560 [Bdellovibrionales bacterium]